MACGASEQLPGSDPLTMSGDIAATMVAGIDRHLDSLLLDSIERRADGWRSSDSYRRSAGSYRRRLSDLIGIEQVDEPTVMREIRPVSAVGRDYPAETVSASGVRACHVQWSVVPGITGEGILLEPKGEPLADVIALPDCDWTPEQLVGLADGVPESSQYARRLAEAGCRVVVPVLINRDDTWSGIDQVARVNQPHREFIYRAAYEVGRYPIGYEVQKVLALVEWFTGHGRSGGEAAPIGIMGYGEGGLLALYASAIDTHVSAAVVSGYFDDRRALHDEPIYRNIFGLLKDYGDAEIASLVTPGKLTIEACAHPDIFGPPGPDAGTRGGAAPGRITTPDLASIEAEFHRAETLSSDHLSAMRLLTVSRGTGNPGSEAVLLAFIKDLGSDLSDLGTDAGPNWPPTCLPNTEHRQRDQFHQIMRHTQHLMRESQYERERFWEDADQSSSARWGDTVEPYREHFAREILGILPPPDVPLNPRTRKLYETETFSGYEVVLDVYQDVIAYGIILIPKGIAEGARRPVVVCQHGLEGRPQDVADPNADHEAYHRFACSLAERGYITYAPQNPYIGENVFRQLLRKAHPLKQTLYGYIVRQHERTLDWLATLSEVDAARIGLYGLSYGGKTAMRIPAVIKRYCLSICSADYNEWIWKNMSDRSGYSYLISGEYDMPEFNLANTFNYAEMSWLISPRPFMVERGLEDGVAPDEWVAYEYVRTYRHYVRLGIPDRTELEVFDGPHTINGVGTFDFLERCLPVNRTDAVC